MVFGCPDESLDDFFVMRGEFKENFVQGRPETRQLLLCIESLTHHLKYQIRRIMSQPQPAPQNQGFGFGQVGRMLMIYFTTSTIFSYLNKGSSAPNSVYTNIISHGEPFTLRVELNDTDPIIWRENNLFYDTSDENYRVYSVNVTAQQLLANPDIVARVFIDIPSKNIQLNTYFSLCKYLKKKKNETKNLMFDANDEYMIKRKEEPTNETKFLHLKSTNYINFVYDSQQYPRSQIPPQFVGKYKFNNHSGNPVYEPYIDVASFRLRRKDHLLVEDDTIDPSTQFTINFEFQTQNYWKFLMTLSLQDSGKVYEQFGMADLMGDEITQDQFKEMFFETNFYLVVVTMIVSLLHTVFSTLAIKNDISYWKNLDSHVGISVRMLYQNFIIEIIVTLYLFDNETSMLILVQSVVELALMVWKILKTTKFERRKDGKFPYFTTNHQSSYTSTTQEHDKQAMKYLYYLLVPLFAGYLVYSLMYEEHKGWYSFFLSSCVGFIYIFGFINMTPQLYINYKLKSVAHLPWRTMIYKFLNTIVDDLFAFIITMPWLKRLSCFRDDIIFLIYIYQRRIYRVDMNRRDVGGDYDRPVEEVAGEKAEVKAEEKGLEQNQVGSSQPVNETGHLKQD